MAYAIVRIGGKQVKIVPGMSFDVQGEVLPNFEVLAYNDGVSTTLGTPVLSDIAVELTLSNTRKSEKVRVARFKSKSRYTKTKGHRQMISTVTVASLAGAKLEVKSKKAEKAEVAKDEVKPVAKKKTATKGGKK